MATSRNATNIWLIDPRSPDLTESKLPSKRQIMSVFFYNRLSKKRTIRESSTITTEALLIFWERARIPFRQKKHVVKSIEKEFTAWQKLKKNKENKGKRSEGLVEKEMLFTNDLDNLFDIAHQDALTMITNPEDKAFLLAQREVGRIGCMGSVDMTLQKWKRDQWNENSLF